MDPQEFIKGKGQIIFVTNNKGGVAKTTLTAHLSDYLTESNISHSLVDVDISGHALQRYKPDTLILDFNESKILQGESDLDKLFEMASKGQTVLVDTGANSGKGLMSWMQDIEFLDLISEYDVAVSFIVPLNAEDKDTLNYLIELNSFVKNKCNVIICKSEVHGTKFDLIFQIIEQRCGKLPTFRFPEIPNKFAVMFKERDLTISSALSNNQLSILDNKRLSRHWKEMKSEFEWVRQLLN